MIKKYNSEELNMNFFLEVINRILKFKNISFLFIIITRFISEGTQLIKLKDIYFTDIIFYANMQEK